TASTGRVGGTEFCPLLRDGWNEAHASPRAREYSEATTDPCGSVQSEPDPTGAAGFGQAAGVEEPAGRAAFAPLFLAAMLEWAESPGGAPHLRSSRCLLTQTTRSSGGARASEIQILAPRAAKTKVRAHEPSTQGCYAIG